MKVKSLYSIFLGILIKKGNKSKAFLTLNTALSLVSTKTNKSVSLILLKIYSKLNTFIENKVLKFRKRTHIVPFPVKRKRSFFLAFKWLIQATQQNQEKTSFSKKLAKEILNLLTTKTAISLKLKKDNYLKARQNRSNLHYRWI